jgi:hypothetical protein
MEQPRPYTKCLGGKGQIYLTECLKPLADTMGNAEFSYCDVQGLLSGGCLTARKMFSQMTEAGFIVKLPNKDRCLKSNRYALHPEVFHIVKQRVNPTRSVPPCSLLA